MRSKRSKAWHLRREIRLARELIEHGDRDEYYAEDHYVGYVRHPGLEADLRALLPTPLSVKP